MLTRSLPPVFPPPGLGLSVAVSLPILRCFDQLAEYRQQETLRLSRSSSCCDDDILLIDHRSPDCFDLMDVKFSLSRREPVSSALGEEFGKLTRKPKLITNG